MSTTAKNPHATVLLTAERIVTALRPFCHRIEIAGSLRRQRPMVGDIEIVCLPKRPVNLFDEPLPGKTELDLFLEERVKLVKNGAKYKQFSYAGRQVDLFLPSPETWGEVFLIRTGSHEFNLWLVQTICPARGVRFDGGRVYRSGVLLETREEIDVLNALELPWIEPSFRDDGRWMELL